MARLLAFGLVVLALVVAIGGCSEHSMERATVLLGGVPVSVWVADTPQLRDAGLQSVPRIEPGEGMLFAWDEPGLREFAIKDVDYALDIVFVNEDRVVTRVATLARGGPEMQGSGGPVLWAIEVPAGWAQDADIRVGDEFEYEPLTEE